MKWKKMAQSLGIKLLSCQVGKVIAAHNSWLEDSSIIKEN